MEIEPIAYSAFQSLTSCTHALRKPSNDGCGWYAATNRRVAGRIYFDAGMGEFLVTVLHFLRAGWEIEELPAQFESFDEAERALIGAMTEYFGKPVTVREVPMRLRFGRGRVDAKG